jgi:hypothetical protein
MLRRRQSAISCQPSCRLTGSTPKSLAAILSQDRGCWHLRYVNSPTFSSGGIIDRGVFFNGGQYR